MEDSDGGVPEQQVEAWQLAAYNMARFRKAAGLTGTELGELLGWSKGTVSAHERAWDGKRRDFSADTLLAIATALRIPVAGLLLPPEDDGKDARYVLTLSSGQQMDMPTLLTFLLPDPSDERNPAMASYRDRVDALVDRHLPEGTLGDDPAALETEDDVAASQERVEQRRQAFRDALAYLGDMDGMLADRLAQIRGRKQ